MAWLARLSPTAIFPSARVVLDPVIPPIHLGISLFHSKWRPNCDILSCQHHGHVTALSDLCVQCDDVERGGRSECASDW